MKTCAKSNFLRMSQIINHKNILTCNKILSLGLQVQVQIKLPEMHLGVATGTEREKDEVWG